MFQRKLVIVFLVFESVLSACNNSFNKILKSKDFEYKLKMADKYFENKNYRQAQQLYEELYPVFKGTDKFEELYYKDAYCFYYLKNYRDAENFFKGFLEVFPNSNKAEEVDFMHALCFYNQSPKLELEQTNTAKAVGEMQTFINTHPGSSRIKEANDIIDKCRAKLEEKELRSADLYFKVGQYRAAARNSFSSSFALHLSMISFASFIRLDPGCVLINVCITPTALAVFVCSNSSFGD